MQDLYENSSIFVSIAAYRDKEIKKTLESLLTQASFPHRVRVGVLSQLSLPDDNELLIGSSANVTARYVPHTDSQGVGWARSKILTEVYAQEDFVLQVDSHMRFEKGWDVKALEQFYSLEDEKAILSGYPSPYNAVTGELNDLMVPFFNCRSFDTWGLPQITSGEVHPSKATLLPRPTVFIGAGCLFMPRKAVLEVPYDPHYVFTGEEVSYAIRLFTHGFNLFTYNVPFLWHNYGVENGRIRLWEDRKDTLPGIPRGARRALALLGQPGDYDSETVKDLVNYGLGHIRSFHDWQLVAGLDFSKREILQRTKEGVF